MNEMIDLTSIYMTNVLGGLLMVSLLVCGGWYIHTRKLTSIILLVLMLATLVGCIVDPLVFKADGQFGLNNYFIVYVGNTLLYLLNIIIGPSFITIIYKYINEKISKIHVNIIYVLCAIETILLLINVFVPIVFYVDDNNVYCRRMFFWVYTVAEVILLFDGIVIYLHARFKGRIRHYFPVWFFIVPIGVGTIIQGMSYGVSMIWPCVSISVAFMVVCLKNEGIYIDKLTGVYNRNYLDSVKSSLRKNHDGNFVALFVDIVGINSINNEYGRNEGDEAISDLAEILSDVVASNGAVIRLGADKFFILLDTTSREELDNCRYGIMNEVETYNFEAGKDYKIELYMGSNEFNLRDCSLHEIFGSFDKVMAAVKYGYKSPVEAANTTEAAQTSDAVMTAKAGTDK